MTGFVKQEEHFALAAGPEDGPVFLAAQEYHGQAELTGRPHLARTYGSAKAAAAALTTFGNTPAGAGVSWRVVALNITTVEQPAGA